MPTQPLSQVEVCGFPCLSWGLLALQAQVRHSSPFPRPSGLHLPPRAAPAPSQLGNHSPKLQCPQEPLPHCPQCSRLRSHPTASKPTLVLLLKFLTSFLTYGPLLWAGPLFLCPSIHVLSAWISCWGPSKRIFFLHHQLVTSPTTVSSTVFQPCRPYLVQDASFLEVPIIRCHAGYLALWELICFFSSWHRSVRTQRVLNSFYLKRRNRPCRNRDRMAVALPAAPDFATV